MSNLQDDHLMSKCCETMSKLRLSEPSTNLDDELDNIIDDLDAIQIGKIYSRYSNFRELEIEYEKNPKMILVGKKCKHDNYIIAKFENNYFHLEIHQNSVIEK